MKKFMNKFLRRFMGKSTTDENAKNALVNWHLDDDDEGEYYEEEDEE